MYLGRTCMRCSLQGTHTFTCLSRFVYFSPYSLAQVHFLERSEQFDSKSHLADMEAALQQATACIRIESATADCGA